MELFKLLGTIAVDNSEANKALKETTSAAKDVGDEFSDAGTKSSSKFGGAMKKVGSVALGVGKTVVTGIGVATTALGGLTVKALSAYSIKRCSVFKIIRNTQWLIKHSSLKNHAESRFNALLVP